jgi:hypothetical protein
VTEELFEVIEANRKFNFARVKSTASGQELHCELFLERKGREDEQLQPGDRVTGLPRGQNLHRVSLIQRASPPQALVAELQAIVHELRSHGLLISLDPVDLAQEEWRSRLSEEGVRRAGLREVLVPQLTFFFDYEKAHPFEDATLIPRFLAAMQRLVPRFHVAAEGLGFRMEPSGVDVALGPSAWLTPTVRYEPLIDAANRLLASLGTPERWHRLPEDWVLARPALMTVLLNAGLLLEREDA